MNTTEIAKELVELCKQGKFGEAAEKFYGQDIVSVEAFAQEGMSRETNGFEAVKAKGAWFEENHEIHSFEVSGPIVAGNQFATSYTIDVTSKPMAQRFTMEEIAVYHVKDGKIVREEFFYSMG